MFCRNCAKEVNDKAVACPGCGVPPLAEKKFCSKCANPTEPAQVVCTKCGASLAVSTSIIDGPKNKLVAGLLGIFLGALGIHKFYLGYNKEGIIMLVVTLVAGTVTCGAAAGIMSIVGLIEGIIYLTKTDPDFESIYVQQKKAWF